MVFILYTIFPVCKVDFHLAVLEESVLIEKKGEGGSD
jgi:hypothetical protein